MKKQILTIASILVLSTLALADKCTPENLGNSQNYEAMNTKWQTGTEMAMNVSYSGGRVTGNVIFNNGKFSKVININGVTPQGKVLYFDPESNPQYGAWEVECTINPRTGTMAITSAGMTTHWVRRASIPANFVPGGNQAPAQPKQKNTEALNDWAPADKNTQYSKPEVQPAPQAVKTYAQPAKTTNPALGDWAPVAQ